MMAKKLPRTCVVYFETFDELDEFAADNLEEWAIRQVVELTCSCADNTKLVVVFEER